MVYYRRDGLFVKKMIVDVPITQVMNLRTKVINECSEIIPGTIESSFGPKIDDVLRIRNVRRGECLGVSKTSDGKDKFIYRYSYDEYKYPKLVHLIDRLLNGDSSAVSELFDFTDVEEHRDFHSMLNDAITGIHGLDVSDKIEQLKRVGSIASIASKNSTQKSTFEYLEKLKHMIRLIPIEEMPLDELAKCFSFMGINPKDFGLCSFDGCAKQMALPLSKN